MAQWGSYDQANNSPVYVASQVNATGGVTTGNQANLYNNVATSAWVSGANVGVFGVDTTEIAVAGEASGVAHSGWNLRAAGTGNRAGRVHYECLIAMGSMTRDGVGAANDDVILPDA